MKKSHNIGKENPRAKLNTAQVIEIKKMLENGYYTHKEIAEQFQVCRSTVSLINIGRIWKHVDGNFMVESEKNMNT